MLILVILVAINRIDAYINFYDYLLFDVINRLDGLELISQISAQINLSSFGTYDLLIFSNFIAGIPFLDAATALKEAGLTSSKNYLLNVILKSSQIDINNSFITDLFYFGGHLFLFLGSLFLGWLSAKTDIAIRSGQWLNNKITCALVFSIGYNFFRIEQDFFGLFISSLRDFIIIYILFLSVRFKKSHFYHSSCAHSVLAHDEGFQDKI